MKIVTDERHTDMQIKEHLALIEYLKEIQKNLF